MNKKSRKRTSKHRQLFFLIATILFLWNCQKEDFFTDATEAHATASKDYHVEKITSKELQSDLQIQPILSKISSKLKSNVDNNTADRSVVVGEGFVILDNEVARITIDSTITWTFKVETPMYETSDIENFMVKKQGDVFTYFLVKYVENDQDAYTATIAQLDGDTLDTSDLNLSARDHLTTPGEDDPLGGGGDGIDCEGEISYEYEACYQPSGSRGGADGHAPTCQHIGGPHINGCDLMCSGSELVMIIDFSHCYEYTGPGGDTGDPGNGNDPNTNQIGSGSGGSSTTTNPNIVTTLVDPRCPPGKVLDANGNCVCPEGKEEDTSGNCVCRTGYTENINGMNTCVEKPCKGDPVKAPEIAPQYGPSGTQGAMFGCTRLHPKTSCGGIQGKKEHKGIDLKNPQGAPIFAMYDGTIYSTKYQKNKAGYNTRIQSTVNGKTIIISYFHLQQNNRVLQGAPGSPLVQVKAGDIIGYQGDSGNLKDAISDGTVDSHVHIEIREHDGSSSWNYNNNFNLVDPRNYLSTPIDNQGVTQVNTNCN